MAKIPTAPSVPSSLSFELFWKGQTARAKLVWRRASNAYSFYLSHDGALMFPMIKDFPRGDPTAIEEIDACIGHANRLSIFDGLRAQFEEAIRQFKDEWAAYELAMAHYLMRDVRSIGSPSSGDPGQPAE